MEDQLVATQKAPPAIKVNENGMQITSFEEMWYFAKRVSESGLAPKDMNRPETIVVALQKGYELGLKPMQSLQNIAVINGRATVWGDALSGIIRASGKCEYINIEEVGTKPTTANLKTWPEDYGYKVSSKRRDTGEEHSATFTVADAKLAGLWEKPSVWNKYPKRMLLNRPRSYCLRDLYSDVLGGIYTAEEIRDTEQSSEDQPSLNESMNATVAIMEADQEPEPENELVVVGTVGDDQPPKDDLQEKLGF